MKWLLMFTLFLPGCFFKSSPSHNFQIKHKKWEATRHPANDATLVQSTDSDSSGWPLGTKEFYLKPFVTVPPQSVFTKNPMEAEEICRVRVNKPSVDHGYLTISADLNISGPPSMYPDAGGYWNGWMFGPGDGWGKDWNNGNDLSGHNYNSSNGSFVVRFPYNTEAELFGSVTINLDPSSGEVTNMIWEIKKGPSNQTFANMASQVKVVCANIDHVAKASKTFNH